MTDAVIVSAARTGLAKSWRGGFNMTHGATLGGHVVKHAVERAKVDPGEVGGRADSAAPSRRRRRQQHRAPDRAARRPAVTVSGATVNRFCSSVCRRSPWLRSA
jgi:acetyl-CoA C-acetyltransferase